MKHLYSFDGAIKDLLQRDLPSLLTRLTGGVKIQAFLNVELAKVQERRVDLLVLLADGTILHLEIQSTHDPEIAYRMLEYYSLVKRRYKRPMRQVLLYVGAGKLRMPDRLAEDGNLVKWDLVDIRGFDADALLATGNPGDLALAILAGGGDMRIRDILTKASRLTGVKRERLLAQILVLAGLRGMVEQVQSEMKDMSVIIDTRDNPFLLKLQLDALNEGKAEALAGVLSRLLETKFGPLPKWAKDRISQADAVRLDRWVNKVLKAVTLEGVLGKR